MSTSDNAAMVPGEGRPMSRGTDLSPVRTLGSAAVDFLSSVVKGSPFHGQVFVAGGYVRDELLGEPSDDIDLVVTAPDGGITFAQWITSTLGIHTTGNPTVFERFGTAKFTLLGVRHHGFELASLDIEVVMTRVERYVEGSRKPDVGYGSLKDDVERRDFTVNALMKDLSTGETLDLTGMGLQDLRAGVVRSTRDPNQLFSEDPLRMLRAVRLATKYDWALPDFMMDAIRANARRTTGISEERIQDEFTKMLMSPRPAAAMKMLIATGLSAHFVPELDAMEGVTQNQFHKDDVLDHSLEVLNRSPRERISRLAALLHDVGKPATRTETAGKIQFLSHETVGADMARDIMMRLKYPSSEIETVRKVVRNHMRLKAAGPDGLGVTDKALRRFVSELGTDLPVALAVMDADNRSHSESASMPDQIAAIRDRIERLSAADTSGRIALPVNGHDIMACLHIAPGPLLAMLLEVIKDAYFEDPGIDRDAALDLANRVVTELRERAQVQDESTPATHASPVRHLARDGERLLRTALTFDEEHPARRAAERCMKKGTG
jgi:poly(A) polymerase